MQNEKDLMVMRYKVIADYPGSKMHFELATIFTWVGQCYQNDENFRMAKDTVERYPHIFKKLEWWEERKVEEMPEYIKHEGIVVVLKIKSWQWDNDTEVEDQLYFLIDGDDLGAYPKRYMPATKQEYNTFLEGLKK